MCNDTRRGRLQCPTPTRRADEKMLRPRVHIHPNDPGQNRVLQSQVARAYRSGGGLVEANLGVVIEAIVAQAAEGRTKAQSDQRQNECSEQDKSKLARAVICCTAYSSFARALLTFITSANAMPTTEPSSFPCAQNEGGECYHGMMGNSSCWLTDYAHCDKRQTK